MGNYGRKVSFLFCYYTMVALLGGVLVSALRWNLSWFYTMDAHKISLIIILFLISIVQPFMLRNLDLILPDCMKPKGGFEMEREDDGIVK